MDKVQRKRILDELAKKDLTDFRRNLPIGETLFPKLFDFVDEKLSEQKCKNDFSIAISFVKQANIDEHRLFNWFREQGIGCDCEILNLEDSFEYLNLPVARPTVKAQIKKQKLNTLKINFGFAIDNVPVPWVLMETINDQPDYSFHLGKSAACLVTLETSFPFDKLNDNQYWLDLWVKATELDRKLEDLTVERPEFENYTCIMVKSKTWTPVLLWCQPNQSAKWFLKMRTELSRHKGDLKEFSKLLNNIQVREE
jgi:hypothetical protein